MKPQLSQIDWFRIPIELPTNYLWVTLWHEAAAASWRFRMSLIAVKPGACRSAQMQAVHGCAWTEKRYGCCCCSSACCCISCWFWVCCCCSVTCWPSATSWTWSEIRSCRMISACFLASRSSRRFWAYGSVCFQCLFFGPFLFLNFSRWPVTSWFTSKYLTVVIIVSVLWLFLAHIACRLLVDRGRWRWHASTGTVAMWILPSE